jgi:hypothetical protein
VIVRLLELIPGGVIRGHEEEKSKPALFVVMKDLCNEGQSSYKTVVKSSKTVKDLVVFDKNSVSTRPISEDLLEKDERAALECLIVLAFRFVMEINDTCNCNIMVNIKTSKVYSIDETSCLTGAR